jgi:DNA-binding response OmpR family regulator
MPDPSILIIDDERDLLELFTIGLRNLRYRVLTAAGGEAAQTILKDETPALIILDIAMPRPNGIDLLHQIRGDARFAATKIIVLTAAPSRLGADDAPLVDLLISKPTTPRGLEQAVVNLIGR